MSYKENLKNAAKKIFNIKPEPLEDAMERYWKIQDARIGSLSPELRKTAVWVAGHYLEGLPRKVEVTIFTKQIEYVRNQKVTVGP